MFGRCNPPLTSPSGASSEVGLGKNISSVYLELSINFQYEIEAGLQHAGMTPEGY
jgi:hypothetical protein